MRLTTRHFSLIFSLLFFTSGLEAGAWVSTPTATKSHKFVYRMKQANNEIQVFEFSSTAPSYEDAYEDAAKACFRHYKNGKRLGEERGLDIIDVCANPRNL